MDWEVLVGESEYKEQVDYKKEEGTEKGPKSRKVVEILRKKIENSTI